MRKNVRLLALICLLFTGQSLKLIGQERLKPVSPVSLGIGNFDGLKSGEDTSYRLNPEDTIKVNVYRENDLDTVTKLDRDGSVVLPLVGEVRLGGMTIKEARKAIEDLYRRDYLVNPQINLTYTPKDVESLGTFTVLGSVEKSGVFSMPKGKDRISLREAIAMAGGVTRYAAESKIKVRRRSGNEDKIFEINLKKMNDDARVATFYIIAGDSINVPESVF